MIVLHADGSVVQIDGSEALLDAIMRELPSWWRPTTATPDLTSRIEEREIVIGAEKFDLPDLDAARAAASRIELAVVGRRTDRAAVHAGAVSVDGQAIVLPGPSRRGKSSLVRALLERGALYLSDEYALIGTDGRVAAYPRSVTIRTDRGSQRWAPAALAATVDTATPVVALIAELTHDPALGFDVRTTTPGEATLALVRNSVGVRRHPTLTMACLTAAAAGSRGLVGTRGEAAEAADWLLAELTRSPTG